MAAATPVAEQAKDFRDMVAANALLGEAELAHVEGWQSGAIAVYAARSY